MLIQVKNADSGDELPLQQLTQSLQCLMRPASSCQAATLQIYAIPALVACLQSDPTIVLSALKHIAEFAAFVQPGESMDQISGPTWGLRRKALTAVAAMCKACGAVILPYLEELRMWCAHLAKDGRLTASEEACMLECIFQARTLFLSRLN